MKNAIFVLVAYKTLSTRNRIAYNSTKIDYNFLDSQTIFKVLVLNERLVIQNKKHVAKAVRNCVLF